MFPLAGTSPARGVWACNSLQPFRSTGGCQGGVRLFGVTSMLEIFRKKDRQSPIGTAAGDGRAPPAQGGT